MTNEARALHLASETRSLLTSQPLTPFRTVPYPLRKAWRDHFNHLILSNLYQIKPASG